MCGADCWPVSESGTENILASGSSSESPRPPRWFFVAIPFSWNYSTWWIFRKDRIVGVSWRRLSRPSLSLSNFKVKIVVIMLSSWIRKISNFTAFKGNLTDKCRWIFSFPTSWPFRCSWGGIVRNFLPFFRRQLTEFVLLLLLFCFVFFVCFVFCFRFVLFCFFCLFVFSCFFVEET